jgi:hypothetical protein
LFGPRDAEHGDEESLGCCRVVQDRIRLHGHCPRGVMPLNGGGQSRDGERSGGAEETPANPGLLAPGKRAGKPVNPMRLLWSSVRHTFPQPAGSVRTHHTRCADLRD